MQKAMPCMHAGASKEVACNVVKRVSESNLRNVRNLDGFARSILRRIEEEGIDVGRADLSALDRDVADAINRHVDDRAVDNSDFSTVQVVNALKEMPVKDAIEVGSFVLVMFHQAVSLVPFRYQVQRNCDACVFLCFSCSLLYSRKT